MAVDPSGADLKRFLAEDSAGPVVMLNLLRLATGRRASYDEYATRIVPFVKRVGGHVVYAGDCSTALVGADGHDWDAVLLVHYPSRAAFSAMVADPEYQRSPACAAPGSRPPSCRRPSPGAAEAAAAHRRARRPAYSGSSLLVRTQANALTSPP